MHITHITSEISPIAKAGGLGDVLHGLSKQQVENGHHVEVILPKYDIIDQSHFDSIEIFMQDLWSYEDGTEFHNTVYKATLENITIFLIDVHHNSYYFNRGLIYGAINDTERFLYFCRAAVEFLTQKEEKPEILHLHDWPVAAVAPILYTLAPNTRKVIGSMIFNIHNMEHQGRIQPKYLTRIGLFAESFLLEDSMQDPLHPGLINLMKGGIHYCDKVVTVSPTYAKEIKTHEYGFGLHLTMEKLGNKLCGVLNGIETNTWDPSTDRYIPHSYPSNSTYVHEIIRKKNENKKALFKELGMEKTGDGPLVICVSRIAKQKGPEYILKAAYSTIEKGGSFMLLGAIADPALEKKFRLAKEHLKNHKNCYLNYTFDEALAHKMFAAADAIFIPSRFEPCGLTQIIAMQYGTVPIARRTGGLKDTIIDDKNAFCNGFLFDDLTEESVERVLDRAFHTFINEHEKWKTLMKNGINREAGWRSPAMMYERIYLDALGRPSSSKNAVL